MGKKSIVIITKPQFGYHTDYFKYAYYLRKFFNITFICWDHGLKKKYIPNIEIEYINISKIKQLNFALFIIRTIRLLKRKELDLILIKYFPLSSLIKLALLKYRFILDIRTGSVNPNNLIRYLKNLLLKVESLLFDNVTIISEELGRYLKIKAKNLNVVPLGSEFDDIKNKKFDEINLLYVGTFFNRRIEDTIIGYKRFLDKIVDKTKTRYTIIGYGSVVDENLIKNTIIKLSLEKFVKFIGRIPNDELDYYYERHNIGISYIPITPYYNYQPPTKTFEYLMNGMICIATNTYANKKIINSNNGVLCDDNSQSFYEALNNLKDRLEKKYNFIVNNSLHQYKWENIVTNKLKPIISKLLNY